MNQVKSKNSPQARSRYRSLIQYVIWTLIGSISVFIFGLLIYNQQTRIDLTGQQHQQDDVILHKYAKFSFNQSNHHDNRNLSNEIPIFHFLNKNNHVNEFKQEILPKIEDPIINPRPNSLEDFPLLSYSIVSDSKNKQKQANIIPGTETVSSSPFLDSNILESIQNITTALSTSKSKIPVADIFEELKSDKNYNKRIKLENPRANDMSIIKLTIDDNPYFIRELNEMEISNPSYLNVTTFNSQNIAKTFMIFQNTPRDPMILPSLWTITEYFDVPLIGDYVKNGGIEVIKNIARDILDGVEYLHEIKHVAFGGLYSTDSVAGKRVTFDGKESVDFKLVDLGNIIPKTEAMKDQQFTLLKRIDIFNLGKLLLYLYQNSNSITNIISKEDDDLFKAFYDSCIDALDKQEVKFSIYDFTGHQFLKEGS